MNVQFVKAEERDRDEVIDLANYVFSHNGTPIDFPVLLPKLYKKKFFMDSIHYLAKEDERVKAVVGAYPLEMQITRAGPKSDQVITVSGRGIGMVSVHPYCRSKGYMKALMKMALDDMKKDGVVFSCLGGQRQRYEYFGFHPAGSSYSFGVNKHNISHTLGRDFKSSLALAKINADEKTALDSIMTFHETKKIRMKRGRDRLFDLLSSWKNEVYIVKNKTDIEGYLVYNCNDYISEIVLTDYSRLCEVLFLVQNGRDNHIRVNSSPLETEKMNSLSRFTGNFSGSFSYQFSVFDYAKLSDALIQSKANLPNGRFVFQLNGENGVPDKKIRLFSGPDGSGAEETDDTAETSLSNKEAVAFLFSPVEAEINPVIKENVFLRALLPLPLHIEDADRI